MTNYRLKKNFNALNRAFQELVKLEPRLKYLEARAVGIGKSVPTRYQLDRFYDNLKPSVCRLAGWGASNPGLKDSEHYDRVYDHVLLLSTHKPYRRLCGFCK